METLLDIFEKIPIGIIFVIGLVSGAIIAELDWRYGSFWKDFRPKKK